MLSSIYYFCEGPKRLGEREPRAKCAGEEYKDFSEPIEIECENERATGEASGGNEIADVSVRFKGCTAFGAPTTSKKSPGRGNTEVNELEGKARLP